MIFDHTTEEKEPSYKPRQANDSYLILSYLIIAGTILTLLTVCYYYL